MIRKDYLIQNSNVKPFNCNICGKISSNSNEMSHTDSKPTCKLCKISYDAKQSNYSPDLEFCNKNSEHLGSGIVERSSDSLLELEKLQKSACVENASLFLVKATAQTQTTVASENLSDVFNESLMSTPVICGSRIIHSIDNMDQMIETKPVNMQNTENPAVFKLPFLLTDILPTIKPFIGASLENDITEQIWEPTSIKEDFEASQTILNNEASILCEEVYGSRRMDDRLINGAENQTERELNTAEYINSLLTEESYSSQVPVCPNSPICENSTTFSGVSNCTNSVQEWKTNNVVPLAFNEHKDYVVSSNTDLIDPGCEKVKNNLDSVENRGTSVQTGLSVMSSESATKCVLRSTFPKCLLPIQEFQLAVKNREVIFESKFKVANCYPKGKGLLSKIFIRKGEFLMYYDGEYDECKKNFLKKDYVYEIKSERNIICINAEKSDGVAKYMNDSLHFANVKPKIHNYLNKLYVAFYAKVDIHPDEELLYTYATKSDECKHYWWRNQSTSELQFQIPEMSPSTIGSVFMSPSKGITGEHIKQPSTEIVSCELNSKQPQKLCMTYSTEQKNYFKTLNYQDCETYYQDSGEYSDRTVVDVMQSNCTGLFMDSCPSDKELLICYENDLQEHEGPDHLFDLDVMQDTVQTNNSLASMPISVEEGNCVPHIKRKSLPNPTKGKKRVRKTVKRPCVYCSMMQTKLTRHLIMMHKDEDDVSYALTLGDKKARVAVFNQLKKKGIHKLNVQLIKDGKNPVHSERKGRQNLVMCGECQGFYGRQTFKRHSQRCAPLLGGKEAPCALMTTSRLD